MSPKIAEFGGMKITMYFERGGRHHWPHVHVYYQGSQEAVFKIPDGRLMQGQLDSRKMKLVESWVKEQGDRLLEIWNELQRSQGPRECVVLWVDPPQK